MNGQFNCLLLHRRQEKNNHVFTSMGTTLLKNLVGESKLIKKQKGKQKLPGPETLKRQQTSAIEQALKTRKTCHEREECT